MNDAVTCSLDVCESFLGKKLEGGVYSIFVAGKRSFPRLALPTRQAQGQPRALADSIDVAVGDLCYAPAGYGQSVPDGELETGAATVERQDFHRLGTGGSGLDGTSSTETIAARVLPSVFCFNCVIC